MKLQMKSSLLSITMMKGMSKMKKSIIVLFCITCIGYMWGCGNRGEVPQTTEFAGNPFDLEAIEETQTVEASYGWWISNQNTETHNIAYNGDEFQLEVTFDNAGGNCEVGMLVFVDGIIQKYTLEKEDKAEYIQPITLHENNSEEIMVLNVCPEFGITGDKHEVQIACMYEPLYRATKENLGYGNYQSILSGPVWSIDYYVDELQEKVDKCDNYHMLTEEVLGEYIYDRNGTLVNQLENQIVFRFLQSNQELTDAVVDCEEDLHYQIFGGLEGEYRICALVNNVPCALFDGSMYMDVSITEEESVEGYLDFSKIEQEIDEYASFYFVICPIGENKQEYMIEKSESLILK